MTGTLDVMCRCSSGVGDEVRYGVHITQYITGDCYWLWCADVPVVSVTWRDVVCACEAPIKKSKSSQKHSEAGGPDPTHSKLVVVHYINKNPKTKKLQCKDVLLETRQGTAEGWITQIEEKRKEGTYSIAPVL